MKTASFRPATGMHPITVSHLDGVLAQRTDRYDLYFWPCPYGQNEVVFDGFSKCDGGLRHLVHRYVRTDLNLAMLDVDTYGHFSPRPYQLGQACDGSITECALALFVSFCRERGFSPDELHRAAYPKEELPAWDDVLSAADWQGVAYPKQWDEKAKSGLLESLHEINCHSLAAIVSELP